jgi:glycosyltransferase involved in cell wall biosynthesis
MRILHVVTRGSGGGTERNLRMTTAAEAARGHDVHIAFGGGEPPSAFGPAITVHSVPSLQRQIHPMQDARALGQLRQLISRTNADVVHTHESKAGVLGRLASARLVPVVVHTVHMASFGPGHPRLGSMVYQLAERSCSALTTLYASVGNDLIDLYVNSGVAARDRFVLVRSDPGIEPFLASRSLSDEQRALLRSRILPGIEGHIILGAGLLEPRKRYDLIIEQLEPLLRRRRSSLLIAGDGPTRERLLKLASQLGVSDRVFFLGRRDDLAALMATSHLFVHASLAEGVPQVVVQAAAAGRHVVATEVEGLLEAGSRAVTVVDRSGIGLREAVEMSLEAPPAPSPVECVAGWAPDAIEMQQLALESQVLELLQQSPYKGSAETRVPRRRQFLKRRGGGA